MNPSTLLLIVTVGISLWGFQDRSILYKLILSPYQVVQRNEWYRVITHAFIHADFMHLIFNMIALWSFGGFVYDMFGQISHIPATHFYIMYFGAIIFSSVSDLIRFKDNVHYSSLGASGAVSAVVFASILFNPWSMILVFFIPIPGIIFGVIYLWYSSYMSRRAGDNVNHGAHLYGAIFGLCYPLIIEPSIIKYFVYSLMHPKF